MANSKSDFITTVRESDEAFDQHCDPCYTENKNLEATAYCKQCLELLCDNCCRDHQKFIALKKHQIFDKAAMAKMTFQQKVTHDMNETCPKHAGKVLKYFCSDHDMICCRICLDGDHSSCENQSYVPDISDRSASSREHKYLVEQLDIVVNMTTNEQTRFKLDAHENDEYRTRMITKIDLFRDGMNEVLNKVVEEAKQNVKSHHQSNSENIKTVKKNCDSVLSDVQAIKTDIEGKAMESKNDNQLFVKMKLASHRILDIKNELKCVTDRNITRYTFDHEKKSQEMMSTVSAKLSPSLGPDAVHAKASFLREVSVKSEKDSTVCLINGIVVLSSDSIVVIDKNNDSVKLVNVERNEVVSRLQLSLKPCDITRIASDHVAVAFFNDGKIEILTVSDVLSRNTTVDMPGRGLKSLTYVGNDNFIILYERDVLTIDGSGSVLSTVYTDSDTEPLFKSPMCIASSPSHDVIYVTDTDANTVTSIAVRGPFISVNRHDLLKSPRGVAVSRAGNVYVCNQDTHTVHELSATGDHVQILLDRKRRLDRLAPYPQAIAHDEDKQVLYVSSGCPGERDYLNYVRLFQLH